MSKVAPPFSIAGARARENLPADEASMTDTKAKWVALIILCLGDLMIVLDTTIVNVALPSIQRSLGFSEANLVWVVNAYMLTFGGFLLLGGRLGDLFGHRRLFLVGISIFTIASLACGLAPSQLLLVAARAVQGAGGAIVSAVALSLIMDLFHEPEERAKAMGFFGFVMAGGGSLGVLLGGVLTDSLSWRWVFLVNLPIGTLVSVLTLRLIEKTEGTHRPLDLLGALLITASLMVLVYGIVGGNEMGWLSVQTLGFIGIGIVLFLAFLWLESRLTSPLVPLGLFRLRNLSAASMIGMLWSAGMFAWFFLSALYMQHVLGYSAMKVGLAFLPSNVIMAAFSLGLSARIVMRFGIQAPVSVGMVLVAVGLALFSRAPVNGDLFADVIPPMIVLGLGAGLALNPLLLAAMTDVDENDSGLASGVVNTAFMMGGSVGLAVLASLAAYVSAGQSAATGKSVTLLAGYQWAFFVGALFALLASFISTARFRIPKSGAEGSKPVSLH
ncbi:MAG TPA: DHA2 family efflux MFS transporter permease subunit [Leptospiraceae bacterium]|nr:DHA2 family efflux MFS transporter permease subunit [Leptospiraceae bacterium]HMX57544.1 DHA2 family efflux MFS transporter permease subunit [Leptospiraceae bacterium]HNL69085.1 DHA2 family efflux MFS transporter permease subunit [Leptospiraceae bacterium]HNN73667.1 DHA2 family efflux MFS transporter permease subunit [Leptospiraceae bacterium]